MTSMAMTLAVSTVVLLPAPVPTGAPAIAATVGSQSVAEMGVWSTAPFGIVAFGVPPPQTQNEGTRVPPSYSDRLRPRNGPALPCAFE